MSEKRSTQAGRTPVRMMTRPELAAQLEQADLGPLEERVIRMRYGLTVADDHPVGGPLMAIDPIAQAEVAELDVSVTVDRALAEVQSKFPGATVDDSYGLDFEIPIDHPWFRVLEIEWENVDLAIAVYVHGGGYR